MEENKTVETDVVDTAAVGQESKDAGNFPALVVTAQQIVPINFNFEELKKRAETITAQYKNVAVTDDTYMASKADTKYLASCRNDIKKKCTEVKKLYNAPVKVFEDQCKELQEIFTTAESEIKTQTEVYDAKRIADKQSKIDAYITAQITQVGLRPEFATGIAETANLSCTLISLKKDAETMIASALKKQQDYEVAVAAAKAAIEANNARIEQKMAFEDPEIQRMLSSDPNNISSLITAKADKIAAAEQAIKEKIIAEERAKAEEIARKAAEAKQVEESAAPISVQPVQPESTIPVFVENTPTAPIAAVPETPIADAAESPFLKFAQQKSEQYKMTIVLQGSFADLQAVGTQLKCLCPANNCSYVVDQEHSGKM